MREFEHDLVTVHLLIFNHKEYLRGCIDSVLAQTYQPLEFIISDNDSQDDSAGFVAENYPRLRLIRNGSNWGYARGHNEVIRSSRGAYFLPLNPDVVLAENYIRELVNAMEIDGSVGMATGKLYRDSNGKIDSAGIHFTPTLRHLDRGSNEEDRGQFDRMEYVFGVSGAAPLLKREMLENIQILGEYFDDDFFAYREDADLSWRAQLLGWKAVYTPDAVACHERRVMPSNRRKTPSEINFHSVKNRFLMRIKNLTWGVGLKTFLFFALRDIVILAYTLAVERTSLKAFPLVFRLLPKAMRKRSLIMSRRVAKERYLAGWFRWRPGRKYMEEEHGA